MKHLVLALSFLFTLGAFAQVPRTTVKRTTANARRFQTSMGQISTLIKTNTVPRIWYVRKFI